VADITDGEDTGRRRFEVTGYVRLGSDAVLGIVPVTM
jgi:hypothetical protein